MIKCNKCNLEFKNYSGLSLHSSKVHNLSNEETYIEYKLETKQPVCLYENCTTKPYFKGATRGFAKYCSEHRGKWQEGLTIQTDDRIRLRSEKISASLLTDKHWSKNEEVAKRTIEKILIARKNRQKKEKKNKKYENLSKGSKWAKGLNKDTDPRIQKISESLRTPASLLQDRWALVNTHLKPDITQLTNVKLPISVLCSSCGFEQKKSLESVEKGSGCNNCQPQSKPQRILEEIVKNCGFEYAQTRKTIAPDEIDIWVEKKLLAIEHNGLYWHSERAGCPKNKHQIKVDKCAEKNITLLQFFEDEVRDKLDIITSMIKHKLGLTEIVYDARKLTLVIIDNTASKEFFDKNHLDGYSKALVTFALKENEKIISAFSLRKPFSNKYKKRTIEVCRYATHINTHVRGGLSKLLSAAKKWAKQSGYLEMISYADQRWGKKHAYEQCGFNKIGETGLRFWWITSNFQNRLSRFYIMAKNNKSQAEIANELNVTRIWGCKNSIYSLSL